jgi:hypothetical protein
LASPRRPNGERRPRDVVVEVVLKVLVFERVVVRGKRLERGKRRGRFRVGEAHRRRQRVHGASLRAARR